MSPSSILIAALIGAGPAQLATPSEPDIVGGELVPAGELLQVVAIDMPGFRCSGTVVAPRLVLTAGHCFVSEPEPSDVTVRIANDADMELQNVSVESWGKHPDACSGAAECKNGEAFDFAYVVLTQPVEFNDGFITPLTEQSEFSNAASPGDDVLLVGFGTDEDGDSGPKRQVEVPINEYVGAGGEFTAGGDGKDSCTGDSGGPAIVFVDGEPRLAGVLSRGNWPCGEGGFYGVPYPILCWLNDETGVDLTNGCGTCDCATSFPVVAKRGCSRCDVDEDFDGDGPAWFLAVAIAFGLRRRTRH